MYQFWYNYIIPKQRDKAKLCYTDTDNFIIYVKTEDLFADISSDVEKYFDSLTVIKRIKYLFQQAKIKKYQVFLKINWEEQ